MQVLQCSCSARPRGSLPAFVWGDVATPIRPITGRHSLSPRSCAHTSMAVPYGSVARLNRAKVWGFRVPRNEYANELGSVFSPAGFIVSVSPYSRELTYPLTFWFKPVSNFGLFLLTMFINSSHVLANIILTLAPLRLLLADSASPHGSAYSFLRVLFQQLHTRQLLILHVSVGSAD